MDRVLQDFTDLGLSIGTSEHPVGRMLEVLRFWFTKDLVRVF